MKKLYLKTYGCQMNVYDSDRIVDLLSGKGYALTDHPDNADMMLINTCHIREKATEKLYSDLGRLRRHKATRQGQGKDTRIIVAGCIAQAEGTEIFRRMPFVDAVVGPQSYHRLPDMLSRIEEKRPKVAETDFDAVAKFDALPQPGRRGVSAYLSIQEGCDKFCSFCVVPYTRGSQYSRPAADILTEARRMVDQGAREIILLGQNVNAYAGDGPKGGIWYLGQLMFGLARIDRLLRIRYTTSHPCDMRDDLYDAHRNVPQVMPFCHLPVQSGSEKILTAMNRHHSIADYHRAIDRLRRSRSDMAFSSDFIVAFPGEDDDDFQATLDLVERVEFAQAYSFKYSPRPGTPATTMQNPIPASTADNRLQTLQSVINRLRSDFNRRFIGTSVPVLIERYDRSRGQFKGRSPWMQPVYIPGPADDERIGTIIDVAVHDCGLHALSGSLDHRSDTVGGNPKGKGIDTPCQGESVV